jgi:Helix-turn-helix domain
MPKNRIFTIEEVADYLRVPANAVDSEIGAGRLLASRIAGLIRIQESDLIAYLDSTKEPLLPSRNQSGATQFSVSNIKPTADFTYVWPNEKREEYVEVREGTVMYGGKQYHVRFGFTIRRSAGKSRRRCLVLVNRYATVEFVSPDEKAKGEMASIIKDRKGKQLPVGATLPPEYRSLPVKPYRDVVKGPGASNGLAVVCTADDAGTMVKHALIRYRFRQER